MVYNNDILHKFSPHIFWDVNIDKIDLQKDKNFLIERIINYGFEKDEILLHSIYSYRILRKTIKKLENIREQAFKCYGKKPSHLNC